MNNNMIINNEFDYSNTIPTIEYISYLVEYCSNVYNQFLKFLEDDKEKNKQYKEEYKNYEYGKNYGERFEIYIRLNNYNNITCKNFKEFKTLIQNNNLKNVLSLEIRLDLDYKRGRGNEANNHENSFSISIKPYDIIFARKSNYSDNYINQIENNINEIFKKIPTINTIFCTK